MHYASDIQWDIPVETYVEALNLEVHGLRGKTDVWCHTCWGNPLAQRIESSYSYKSVLPYLDRLDVDVITFETADNDGAELAEIAAAVSRDKKICIGVVSHRTLQVEMPEDVAALIRKALKHIAPEQLILSSDCGFGRQGMSRIHAFYKMIATCAAPTLFGMSWACRRSRSALPTRASLGFDGIRQAPACPNPIALNDDN